MSIKPNLSAISGLLLTHQLDIQDALQIDSSTFESHLTGDSESEHLWRLLTLITDLTNLQSLFMTPAIHNSLLKTRCFLASALFQKLYIADHTLNNSDMSEFLTEFRQDTFNNESNTHPLYLILKELKQKPDSQQKLMDFLFQGYPDAKQQFLEDYETKLGLQESEILTPEEQNQKTQESETLKNWRSWLQSNPQKLFYELEKNFDDINSHLIDVLFESKNDQESLIKGLKAPYGQGLLNTLIEQKHQLSDQVLGLLIQLPAFSQQFVFLNNPNDKQTLITSILNTQNPAQISVLIQKNKDFIIETLYENMVTITQAKQAEINLLADRASDTYYAPTDDKSRDKMNETSKGAMGQLHQLMFSLSTLEIGQDLILKAFEKTIQHSFKSDLIELFKATFAHSDCLNRNPVFKLNLLKHFLNSDFGDYQPQVDDMLIECLDPYICQSPQTIQFCVGEYVLSLQNLSSIQRFFAQLYLLGFVPFTLKVSYDPAQRDYIKYKLFNLTRSKPELLIHALTHKGVAKLLSDLDDPQLQKKAHSLIQNRLKKAPENLKELCAENKIYIDALDRKKTAPLPSFDISEVHRDFVNQLMHYCESKVKESNISIWQTPVMATLFEAPQNNTALSTLAQIVQHHKHPNSPALTRLFNTLLTNLATHPPKDMTLNIKALEFIHQQTPLLNHPLYKNLLHKMSDEIATRLTTSQEKNSLSALSFYQSELPLSFKKLTLTKRFTVTPNIAVLLPLFEAPITSPVHHRFFADLFIEILIDCSEEKLDPHASQFTALMNKDLGLNHGAILSLLLPQTHQLNRSKQYYLAHILGQCPATHEVYLKRCLMTYFTASFEAPEAMLFFAYLSLEPSLSKWITEHVLSIKTPRHVQETFALALTIPDTEALFKHPFILQTSSNQEAAKQALCFMVLVNNRHKTQVQHFIDSLSTTDFVHIAGVLPLQSLITFMQILPLSMPLLNDFFNSLKNKKYDSRCLTLLQIFSLVNPRLYSQWVQNIPEKDLKLFQLSATFSKQILLDIKSLFRTTMPSIPKLKSWIQHAHPIYAILAIKLFQPQLETHLKSLDLDTKHYLNAAYVARPFLASE